eukprot:2474306-Amphidinium_carterae.1
MPFAFGNNQEMRGPGSLFLRFGAVPVGPRQTTTLQARKQHLLGIKCSCWKNLPRDILIIMDIIVIVVSLPFGTSLICFLRVDGSETVYQ